MKIDKLKDENENGLRFFSDEDKNLHFILGNATILSTPSNDNIKVFIFEEKNYAELHYYGLKALISVNDAKKLNEIGIKSI